MPHAQQLKKAVAPCAALLLTALWLLPVQAQSSLHSLSDPAFGEARALSVPFKHNEHNAKAKLTNCAACHHDFSDGTRVMTGQGSTERRCSYCHQAQPAPTDRAPALMMAYHKLCQDCHREKGKGPLKCSGCHVGK